MFRSPMFRSPAMRRSPPKKKIEQHFEKLDPDVLNFIQEQVQLGISTNDAYEKFCRVHTDKIIKYTVFNCWYYRQLVASQPDLNQSETDKNDSGDREIKTELIVKSELESYETQNLEPEMKQLMDMPKEIIAKMIAELDWEDRFTLQKVCRRLRSLVTNQPIRLSKLFFQVFETHAKLKFNNQSVDYHEAFNGLLVVSGNKYKHLERIDDWRVALNDLIVALQLPKLVVKKLFFEFNFFLSRSKRERVVETTGAATKLLSRRAHVKYLSVLIQNQEEILTILPYLEPGVLESIEIRHFDKDNYIDFDQIVELDQWKQARNLWADSIDCHVSHLKHFSKIQVTLPFVTVQDIIELKDALSTSDHFKSCRLSLFPTVDIEKLQLEMGRGTQKDFVIEYGVSHVSFRKI
ncbi:unnamed protein product [Caenorhabditis brenneri]